MQMRTKKSHYFNSVISSQHITHVDPEKGRALPCNFIKHSINVGTWNVLSLESSPSELFDLSQNMSPYKMELTDPALGRLPGMRGLSLLTLEEEMDTAGKGRQVKSSRRRLNI